MVKSFLLLGSMLLLAMGMVLGHYFSCDRRTQQEALSSMVTLTKLSSPSLSVAYYEPRVFFSDRASNPAYPQMQPINRMDFVYAK